MMENRLEIRDKTGTDLGITDLGRKGASGIKAEEVENRMDGVMEENPVKEG